MRYLGDMLEATTVAYDNLQHHVANRPILLPSDIKLAGVALPLQYGLTFGMKLEVGQYAAHCCGLALKTLYAIRNPDAKPRVFKDIGHDISQAWKKLEGEQGFLIDIMRNMPVLPATGAISELGVRSAISMCADFDELRFYELSESQLMVSPITHLRLAWATFVRCDELVGRKPTPSQRQARSKISRNTPSSLSNKPSRNQETKDNADLRDRHMKFNGDPTILPDWLRLVMSMGGLGGYNPDSLKKTRFGLIHTSSNEYLSLSTAAVLMAWTLERCSSCFDPNLTDTGLGDVEPLMYTLHGRLEEITMNYATNTGILEIHSIDGEPLKDHFMGQFLIHTQAAVFACELTLKWLYAIMHPEAPLRYYKKTHDVLRLWKRIGDHRDNILDVFHAMPLFQADGPIHKREHVSAEKLRDLLSRFRTTYVDARYGITDPSRDVLEIADDYRITLHLAWSVFVYGLQSIFHHTHK